MTDQQRMNRIVIVVSVLTFAVVFIGTMVVLS